MEPFLVFHSTFHSRWSMPWVTHWPNAGNRGLSLFSEKMALVPSTGFIFRPFDAFFGFWRRENWGERNTDGRSGEGEGKWFCARPNFRAFKKRKMLQICGRPYRNACYTGYSFTVARSKLVRNFLVQVDVINPSDYRHGNHDSTLNFPVDLL